MGVVEKGLQDGREMGRESFSALATQSVVFGAENEDLSLDI